MQEEILRRFFEGKATASELAEDIAGSKTAVSSVLSVVHVRDMDNGFKVDRGMAISLCDVVLAGTLPPDALPVIGFALMASDKFFWDEDDLLSDVIGDWSCPEINYPLTIENIGRFKACCRNWNSTRQSHYSRKHRVGISFQLWRRDATS